jgi:hypothetical protein
LFLDSVGCAGMSVSRRPLDGEQFCTVIAWPTGLILYNLRNVPLPTLKKRAALGASGMTNKTTAPHGTKKQAKVRHPGMMGDGTEEQNLGERGNSAARIKKTEVSAAFSKQRPKK